MMEMEALLGNKKRWQQWRHKAWAPPPPETGNLLINVNEDQNEELPVLRSIWECLMINKLPGLTIMGILFLDGLLAGAPLKTMACHQNPIGQ